MKVNIESLISNKSLDELRRLQGLISTRINTLSNDKTPINISQYIAHESCVIPPDLLRRCHDEVRPYTQIQGERSGHRLGM